VVRGVGVSVARNRCRCIRVLSRWRRYFGKGIGECLVGWGACRCDMIGGALGNCLVALQRFGGRGGVGLGVARGKVGGYRSLVLMRRWEPVGGDGASHRG